MRHQIGVNKFGDDIYGEAERDVQRAIAQNKMWKMVTDSIFPSLKVGDEIEIPAQSMFSLEEEELANKEKREQMEGESKSDFERGN